MHAEDACMHIFPPNRPFYYITTPSDAFVSPGVILPSSSEHGGICLCMPRNECYTNERQSHDSNLFFYVHRPEPMRSAIFSLLFAHPRITQKKRGALFGHSTKRGTSWPRHAGPGSHGNCEHFPETTKRAQFGHNFFVSPAVDLKVALASLGAVSYRSNLLDINHEFESGLKQKRHSCSNPTPETLSKTKKHRSHSHRPITGLRPPPVSRRFDEPFLQKDSACRCRRPQSTSTPRQSGDFLPSLRPCMSISDLAGIHSLPSAGTSEALESCGTWMGWGSPEPPTKKPAFWS